MTTQFYYNLIKATRHLQTEHNNASQTTPASQRPQSSLNKGTIRDIGNMRLAPILHGLIGNRWVMLLVLRPQPSFSHNVFPGTDDSLSRCGKSGQLSYSKPSWRGIERTTSSWRPTIDGIDCTTSSWHLVIDGSECTTSPWRQAKDRSQCCRHHHVSCR